MNFVKQIMDELSGDTLGQLSSLLGVDDETAETAVSAAAPSLLAGLASLATQSDGARKLTNALGSFGDAPWGNLGEMLGGDTSSLFERGGNLLNNLFSAKLLDSLSSSIARFAGINSGTARNLLAYLAPLLLGKVASLWRSRGGDAAALTGFLAEQKEHIVDAMPAGFSLQGVPGLANFGQMAHSTGRRTQTAPRSMASWAVPLALLLAAAVVLWNVTKPREAAEKAAENAERTTAMKPVVPENSELPTATELTDNLQSIFESAETTFAKIEDSATAEAAKPELEALSAQLDTARETLGKLPEMGQNMARKFVDDHFGSLKEKIDRIGMIPTLQAEIKTLIDEIVEKFNELSGEFREAL